MWLNHHQQQSFIKIICSGFQSWLINFRDKHFLIVRCLVTGYDKPNKYSLSSGKCIVVDVTDGNSVGDDDDDYSDEVIKIRTKWNKKANPDWLLEQTSLRNSQVHGLTINCVCFELAGELMTEMSVGCKGNERQSQWPRRWHAVFRNKILFIFYFF